MLAKWNPFANSGLAHSGPELPVFDDFFREADRLFESALAMPPAVARSFVLPPGLDTAKCEAHYEHGVLTLSLPRLEESKPRSISVKVKS